MARLRGALDHARALVGEAAPIALVGVVYAAMRPFADVGLSPARVHTCDLQALDARAFGVTRGGAALTVHDWIAPHRTTALDLFFAIPYGTFVLASVTAALLLHFRDAAALRRFAWSFLAVNLAGFATYHLYPAAPPWYVHAHGCAVDLAARPSEGPALAHVDALTGVPFFAWMYGRSSAVFGAMPSLHVTYPLLIVLAGWRALGRAGRLLACAYFAWMCVAAVYLDHHWVVDVVAGSAYAASAFALVAMATRWRAAEPPDAIDPAWPSP